MSKLSRILLGRSVCTEYRLAIMGPRRVNPSGPAAKSDASDRPSIAVLPFDNISGDPEQEYFADGQAAVGRLRRYYQLHPLGPTPARL